MKEPLYPLKFYGSDNLIFVCNYLNKDYKCSIYLNLISGDVIVSFANNTLPFKPHSVPTDIKEIIDKYKSLI